MRYAGIVKNDFAAAPGVSVSFYAQGCPHHCSECHNPQTWDFNGGREFTNSTLNELLAALNANGVQRNLSILGGEPLCDENLFLIELVCSEVLKVYPNLKTYIWTGYTFEELRARNNSRLNHILEMIYCLIDGPYIKAERDITLKMRGSKNQRIIDVQKTLATGAVCEMK